MRAPPAKSDRTSIKVKGSKADHARHVDEVIKRANGPNGHKFKPRKIVKLQPRKATAQTLDDENGL